MSARHVAILGLVALLLAPAPIRAEEEKPPPVNLARVREILAAVRKPIETRTGLPWPEDLEVERTDPAGMAEVLRDEFEEQIATLHPHRSPAARRHLVNVLARSYARILRAKYGLRTGKIHVSPGALARLPEGVDPDDALVWLVAHEAVHAVDDRAAGIRKLLAAAPDAEAKRAVRMVIEGRAEHYGAAAAATLGVSAETGRAFAAGRDEGESLLREAGRAFVAALEKRDPKLATKALLAPPRLTATVFHPARYPDFAPPDFGARLAAALPGAKREVLSELLLRTRFGERLPAGRVAAAFAGFVTGAAATAQDGTRVSLVALDGEANAARFLALLREFEGVGDAAGSAARVAPDGRRYAWAAAAGDLLVAEAVVPGEGDAAALAAKALE